MTPFAILAVAAVAAPLITIGIVQAPDPVSPPPKPSPTSTIPQPPPSGPDDEFDATPAPTDAWRWPLLPPQVVRGFTVGPARWSPGHRGVDLATAAPGRATAGAGAVIRAPAGGTVRYAGRIAGRPVLAIDHGHGLVSSFEPVLSRLRPGQPVAPGSVLGRIGGGPTHCAPRRCLHWGVRRDGRYIDPLTLVPRPRGPAVLLPMHRP
jgi:murein DD-endopeptidase MepM/ murein hydrolase activator NlpD